MSVRSPHHHVQLLCDPEHQLTAMKSDGIAVILDFAKAYDRVNWGYMLDVLQHMGFGSRFCVWVQVLHRNSQALLDVNNKLLPAVPRREASSKATRSRCTCSCCSSSRWATCCVHNRSSASRS